MRSRRRRRVVIGQTAARELGEALDDVEARSAGAAGKILDAIDACVERLARFPESSPVDPSTPPLLLGPAAQGRKTHAVGFTIRYAFPVKLQSDPEVVLILSIRHGRRRPLGDPEFLRRFLAELVRGRSAGSPAPTPRQRPHRPGKRGRAIALASPFPSI